MDFTEIKKRAKKFWRWIWNSESILSWIVALVLIFILIKFIFFPVLSLIMGNSLPLAGVESSSMDHQMTKYCERFDSRGKCSSWGFGYKICGKVYSAEQKENLDFDEYWETCGEWYEEKDISKQTFSDFSMKNGFKKGDIIIVWGRFTPKIGDIVIFNPNPESISPHPIIHRIVKIEDGTIQTKGDHNEMQLTINNNNYNTDETNIKQEQLIGKAIIKIPLLGWPKIWFTELFKAIQR